MAQATGIEYSVYPQGIAEAVQQHRDGRLKGYRLTTIFQGADVQIAVFHRPHENGGYAKNDILMIDSRGSISEVGL